MSSQHLLVQLLIAVTVFSAVNSQGVSTVPSAFCSAGGFKCDVTCRYLGACIRSAGNESYTWSAVRNCGTQYCDAKSVGCSMNASACEVENPVVECITAGVYPDPSNCKVFYKCDPDNGAVSYQCPPGKRFNSCTAQCDVESHNDACPVTVPPCKTSDVVQAYPENKRIYYYCIEAESTLNYVMNQCVEGAFDNKSRTCVPGTSTGCNAVDNDTGSGIGGGSGSGDNTGGSNGTTVSPGIEENKVKCTTAGIMADPDSCKGFYYCNTNLTAIHLTCDVGYHFVLSQSACVKGDCVSG